MDSLEEKDFHNVYGKDVLEMVTVASEFCGFLELTEHQSKKEFIDKIAKILALLYLKTTMVNKPERVFDEPVEAFVTEEDYHQIQNNVSNTMGADDDYLEVFHPDIQYSDGPVRASISEDLADIYQYLKNLTSLFGMGTEEIMNDALCECLDYFGEHWGQKLVNVLRALHQAKYQSQESEENSDNPDERDDFYTRFQNEWGKNTL